LIPAPHHKDTTHTKQAVMAFREFISRFPKHKLVPKARKKMLFSLNLMAQQELNVAKFYAKRGKYRAVVWRMDFLLKTYPKVQLTAEARFFRADALRRLKRYTEAGTEFGTIVKDHPKSSFANQAKGWIPKMKQLAKQTSKPKSPKPSSGGKKPTARPKAR
jgi:outer membrane protein assembly factor BamD